MKKDDFLIHVVYGENKIILDKFNNRIGQYCQE
jgi:hypothetical protein